MALCDWQAALGQLVEAHTAGRLHGSTGDALASRRHSGPGEALAGVDLDGLDLDDTERAWLAALPASRGFALTCRVPRWWRETRVRRTARLTLAAIAAIGDDAVARLADYLRAVPGFTLFFVPEGLAFLDHIIALAVHPLVDAVARFERAMWHARLAATDAGRAATVIAFPAPPDLVFAALLASTPLPALTAELHDILVAPGIPGLWRLAAADPDSKVYG